MPEDAPDIIALHYLARELGVSPATLIPALDGGYLRRIPVDQPFDHIMVERPLPWMMQWMLIMYSPPAFKPMIPLEHVGAILQIPVSRVRRICEHFYITIFPDEVFGDLLSIRGYHELSRYLKRAKRKLRTDRMAILASLEALRSNSEISRKSRALQFSYRLDEEVKRIATLKEPTRSVYATSLWMAYRDARCVSDCLAQYKRNVKVAAMHLRKVEIAMDSIEAGMTLPDGWDLSARQYRRKKRYNSKVKAYSQAAPSEKGPEQ